MTTPINPDNPAAIPPLAAPSAAPPAGGFQSESSIDPTGVWSKFLSTPGHPATAKDVKMFMEGLMKSFNVLIQQEQRAMARARRQMQRAEKGE